MKKEIDDKIIKNSIEYVLTWEIQISMLVYFNNIKVKPELAFSKNIEFTKRLITAYHNFKEKKSKLSKEQLRLIYNDLCFKKYKLPFISDKIEESDFIQDFDDIYENYYTNFQQKIVKRNLRGR